MRDQADDATVSADATDAEGAQEPPKRRNPVVSFAKETIIVVVTALVLSLLVKTFLVQAFYIPSQSMEPTLIRGDRVLVSQLTPGPIDLKRGDVVVFKDPGNWLVSQPAVDRGPIMNGVISALTFIGVLPQDSGEHLIKRIVAMSGDTVACCDVDGRVTVNDVPLEEPYVYPGDSPSDITFEVTVEDESVWLMGDHRSASQDSRWHQDAAGTGSVPVDMVVGRAVTIIWPLTRMDWLGNYPETFEDVPAP